MLVALAACYERWDGKGYPGDLSGENVPLVSRICQLAEFMEVAHRSGGVGCRRVGCAAALGKAVRSGARVGGLRRRREIFHGIEDVGSWDDVIDAEPALAHRLTPAQCDEALAAIGRFVDLKSPYTLGHSGAVAELTTAPSLLEVHGVGVDTASTLLVAAGDNPQRLRSEAAWAHVRCRSHPGVVWQGDRWRLNRGGDRQANGALWVVVITRMSSDPLTRLYVERRLAEGRSKPEIIRILKRYVAREVYRHLPRGPKLSWRRAWLDNRLTLPGASWRTIRRPATANQPRVSGRDTVASGRACRHQWLIPVLLGPCR